MNTDLLQDVFTEQAGRLTLAPEVVDAARRRGRWMKQAERIGAGLTATAVAAGAVLLVAGQHRGTDNVQAAGHLKESANAGPLVFPDFPLTPAYLPPGVGKPLTGLFQSPETFTLSYLPAKAEAPLKVLGTRAYYGTVSGLQIAVASTPPDVVQVAPARAITIAGRPGTLYDGHLTEGEVSVTFQQGPGLDVVVTGDRDFASVAMVERVAASLTRQPVPATPPFSITDVPAAYARLAEQSPSSVFLYPTGTTGDKQYAAAGDGIIVSLSRLATKPGPGVGTAVMVGSHPATRYEEGLLVDLGNHLYLQVLSHKLDTAQLVAFAREVTVLPAAAPMENSLSTLGG